jgi:hypothetical protein
VTSSGRLPAASASSADALIGRSRMAFPMAPRV